MTRVQRAVRGKPFLCFKPLGRRRFDPTRPISIRWRWSCVRWQGTSWGLSPGASSNMAPPSGCASVCVCAVHLRRSCIVYSAHRTSKEWVSRGVLVEHWFSSVHYHTGEKKHPDVCVPGQRADPLRPTGVRPSCQQTWGGDHSLRFYFCRPNVIIKQLST